VQIDSWSQFHLVKKCSVVVLIVFHLYFSLLYLLFYRITNTFQFIDLNGTCLLYCSSQ
jgi:hypothetical protein